jgi:hypothetical protein
MADNWGRVKPKVEAFNATTGKALKTTVTGWSLRPDEDEGLNDYAYHFMVGVGKDREVNILLTRNDLNEMLDEIGDRAWEDLTGEPLDSGDEEPEEELTFDWDAFWAGLEAEVAPEPEKPVPSNEDEAEALFKFILDALTYEPTPDQKKARDLLDSWGWEEIDYHRDGHLIRAVGNGNIHVWHAEAIVAQDEAKARGDFRSATDCPTHGDTLEEHLAMASR